VSVPNLLTLLRMVLVPVVVWLIINGAGEAAFWLFVLAGVTDAVDGFIAKRFNQATLLGAYLDPVADKLLLVGVFVTLGVVGDLPSWLVVLVVSRDVMIVIAFAIAYLVGRPVRVRPLPVSKANTAAQIVLVGGVLADLGLGISMPAGLLQGAIVVVAFLTALSWAIYFAVWTRHLAGSPATRPGPPEVDEVNGRGGR
jgi:cardiolipin synthase (CMP-forming)